jgi:hypothetical protein
VSDFDPGNCTVALTGACANGADQGKADERDEVTRELTDHRTGGGSARGATRRV